MSTPVEQSQLLATNGVTSLFEFDFTSIGGSTSVYLASSLQDINNPQPITIQWVNGVQTFEYIEIDMSGVRSDTTGNLAEPMLQIAAHRLWSFSDWASATSGFNLLDYRGLRVRRQRLFYDTATVILPQTFYIKSVDELSSNVIAFSLTPMLGGDTVDKPSARKLEL